MFYQQQEAAEHMLTTLSTKNTPQSFWQHLKGASNPGGAVVSSIGLCILPNARQTDAKMCETAVLSTLILSVKNVNQLFFQFYSV